jgi:hypothetical protein
MDVPLSIYRRKKKNIKKVTKSIMGRANKNILGNTDPVDEPGHSDSIKEKIIPLFCFQSRFQSKPAKK